MKIGDLCVKLSGRDAGKKCVVLKAHDNNRVLIDGETRRRLCALSHLEPLNKTLDLKEEASHEDVVSAFKIELGVEIVEKKSKKATGEKPRKVRKVKEKPVKNAKVEKVAKIEKPVKEKKVEVVSKEEPKVVEEAPKTE
jgi:large subunit ribosomal protein L14e